MDRILIGKGEGPVYLLAPYGNRHGLVAGATGTGKTVSLLVMAEGFSRLGVPVVMADVKGDVAGLAMPGTPNPKIDERAASIGMEDWAPEGSPVLFWDLYGKAGHPVRTTISEIGPTLLARMLELNDTQEGVLEVMFRLADEQGLLLLDMDDLRALLGYVAEHRKEVSEHYGLVAGASIAAIQRSLLALDREGGTEFFGEPALELADLMRTDLSGRGVISVLSADQLILKPRLYSSFLLWLLSELFEQLPEVGDQDRPRLVFVFDEAHLLFDDAPPALRQRVEQVVRIIRSKGRGRLLLLPVPRRRARRDPGTAGEPDPARAARLHAARPEGGEDGGRDLRGQSELDVAEAIGQLGVGEALVSTLQEKGVPMPVQRTLICPPRCRMGAITDEERAAVRTRSPVGAKYDTPVNRESAYEKLAERAEEKAAQAPPPVAGGRAGAAGGEAARAGKDPARSSLGDMLWGTTRRQGMVETMAKQAARTVGSQVGRQILRGVLGGILGGSRR